MGELMAGWLVVKMLAGALVLYAVLPGHMKRKLKDKLNSL